MSDNVTVDASANQGVAQKLDPRVSKQIKQLSAAVHLFGMEHAFKVGDFVEWKPYMKNKRFPDYGEVAVVVEVINPPIFNEEANYDSAYYQEPLSLRLGLFSDDGDFYTYLYDGRRLQVVEGTGPFSRR